MSARLESPGAGADVRYGAVADVDRPAAALTAADWDEHLPYLGSSHPAWEFGKWQAGTQP